MDLAKFSNQLENISNRSQPWLKAALDLSPCADNPYIGQLLFHTKLWQNSISFGTFLVDGLPWPFSNKKKRLFEDKLIYKLLVLFH